MNTMKRAEARKRGRNRPIPVILTRTRAEMTRTDNNRESYSPSAGRNVNFRIKTFSPANLIALALLIAAFLLAAHAESRAAELQGVELAFRGQDLLVSTALVPDASFAEEMKQGLSKEIHLSFEVMGIRSFVPDEYILARKVRITLKSDPIKREFAARITDRDIVQEKRFKDVESMNAWALGMRELKITNVKELDAGTYYVKVTAESRIRKLPPLIKYLLFFIPETEFTVVRYSRAFSLPIAPEP